MTCTPIFGPNGPTGWTLTCNYIQAGTAPTQVGTVTYSSVDHRWWRIREAAGFTFWETSGDATALKPDWTRQARVYNLFRDRTFTVQFKTGVSATVTGAQLPFKVASFNTGRKANRAV